MEVFDILLNDVRRLKKVSFAGLIQTTTQVERLVSALKRGGCVTDLDLSCCSFGEDGVWSLCDFLKTKECCVSRLTIEACRLSENDCRLICDTIVTNNSLTELNARSCNLLHVAIPLRDALCRNGTLTSLILSDNDLRVRGSEVHIADALKTNSSLKNLCMEGNSFWTFNAKALSDALKLNEALTRLDLSGNMLRGQQFADWLKVSELLLRDCGLGRGGSIALCDALKTNSSLTVLDLNYNNLGSEDGHAIGGMLRHNRTLTSLAVGDNALGSDGLLAIEEGLEENPVLKKFVAFRINNVGQFLGLVLKGNSSLTEIDVCWNKIGVDGERQMSDGLQVNKTLKRLHLYDVSLGDDALTLADALKVNRSLKFLDLGCNHLNVGLISDALVVNPSLEELRLMSTGICHDDCFEIARMITLNKSLKRLDMRNNTVGRGILDIF